MSKRSGSSAILYIFCFVLISATTASAASSEPVFVRIRAVGDTMLGNTPNSQVPSFNYLHKIISETRNADISFINYEGTLCDQDLKSHKCNGSGMCFAFRGPTRLAKDVADAGFDIVNLANNHIFDYGHGCATETKKAIEDNGMLAIGLMDRPGSTGDIMRTMEFGGKKILFIGIHYSNAWGRVLSINETEKIRELVSQNAKNHDMTVVSVHYGAEGPAFNRTPMGKETHKGENRGDMRQFSKMVIDAGADLVIGHGPHVLRGLELYKGKLIIHSLGNFGTYTLFSMDEPMNRGAIVEAGLDANGGFVEGRILPVYQYYEKRSGGGRGPIHLDFDPSGRAIQEIRTASEADFTSRPVIRDDGRFEQP